MRKSFLLVLLALCLCSFSVFAWGANVVKAPVVYQGPPEPPK
jgi:hypothetical protein